MYWLWFHNIYNMLFLTILYIGQFLLVYVLIDSFYKQEFFPSSDRSTPGIPFFSLFFL